MLLDQIQLTFCQFISIRFIPRDSGEVPRDGLAGRFEIAEGQVWQVRLMNGTALIEFANASNFQLTVPPVSLREFRDTHFDIRRLRGRVIRVRGWIGLDRQPTMAIANPALIEIRDGPPARRR